jgi:hypothetical protein
MEIANESRGDFYRKLLSHARIFLTEVDGKSSGSVSESQSRSVSPSSSSIILTKSNNCSQINDQLISTRQRCHQRLLTCSRKKLRLLSLQEQVGLTFE